MLQCPLLAHPCTLDDLQKFNENARKCVDNGRMRFDDTKEEDGEIIVITSIQLIRYTVPKISCTKLKLNKPGGIYDILECSFITI